MNVLLWLLTPLGRIVGTALAVVVFLAGFAFYFEQKGEQKIIARQEQVDNEARNTRTKIDDEVFKAPIGDLDKRLGRWMRND